MRFKVLGADKETGNDIEIEVTAIDRAEAENVATKRGVLVAEVQPIKAKDLDPIPLNDIDLAAAEAEKPSAGTVAAVEVVAPAASGTTAGAKAQPAPAPSAASVAGASAGSIAGASVAGSSVAGASAAGSSQAPSSGDTQSHGADPHPTAVHGAPMEYHVIMNQSLYLMELAVNKHIKQGWEPQGGLCIGVWNNAMQYFQAVIRHKD